MVDSPSRAGPGILPVVGRAARWRRLNGLFNNGLFVLNDHGVQYMSLTPDHVLCKTMRADTVLFYMNFLRGVGYDVLTTEADDDGFPVSATAVLMVPGDLAVKIMTSAEGSEPAVVDGASAVVAADSPPTIPVSLAVAQLIVGYEPVADHRRRAFGGLDMVPVVVAVRMTTNKTTQRLERHVDGFLTDHGMLVRTVGGALIQADRPPCLYSEEYPIPFGSYPCVGDCVNALRGLGYEVNVTGTANRTPVSAVGTLYVPRWMLQRQLRLDLPPFVDGWSLSAAYRHHNAYSDSLQN